MEQNNNLKQQYEVSPFELCFDLIYAFALSQVTEFLLDDLAWITILEAVIILGAVYMVWSYTSWAVTMIPIEQQKSRQMILIIMLLGFIMNASINQAFDGKPYLFAGLYLLIHGGRTVWTLINSPSKAFKEHFHRVLIWYIISAPFWLIGIFCPDQLRIILWSIGIALDLVGTWTAHPIFLRKFHSEDIYFDDGHLLERCRLFRIIAFGEMVFSAGAALQEADLSTMSILLASVSMIEIIALLSLTFGRFVNIVAKHREKSSNPILISRYAINALVIIMIGIVFMSAGNKYIILHPYEKLPLILVCLIISGPIMFLLAQGWYLYKIPQVRPTLYLISGIVFLLSVIVGLSQTAWIYHLLIGTIFVIVTCLDIRYMNGDHR